MWATEITRKSKVRKEKIWKIWTTVSAWNIWDADVEYSSILGEFKVGTPGVIKSKGGPKTKFSIVECTEMFSFTNRTRLPLCTIDFIHTLSEKEDGVEITHKVEMTGLSTFLFSRIIGKGLMKSLPDAVDVLIKQAEDGE